MKGMPKKICGTRKGLKKIPKGSKEDTGQTHRKHPKAQKDRNKTGEN